MIALVAFAYFGSNAVYQALLPKPPIEITASIDKSSIRVGEYATVTISIKNIDLKTHNIRFFFDASLKIIVYAGTEQPLLNNEYSMAMDATSPSDTKAFTFKASLDEKETSTDYPIVLHVYVDGAELKKTWNDFSLHVTT